MKKLMILVMVGLLAVLIATPALAKPDKGPDRAKIYTKADKAKKAEMRADTLAEAEKIQKKRISDREQVDAKMKERLKNIKADSPGNIGPIGGQ